MINLLFKLTSNNCHFKMSDKEKTNNIHENTKYTGEFSNLPLKDYVVNPTNVVQPLLKQTVQVRPQTRSSSIIKNNEEVDKAIELGSNRGRKMILEKGKRKLKQTNSKKNMDLNSNSNLHSTKLKKSIRVESSSIKKGAANKKANFLGKKKKTLESNITTTPNLESMRNQYKGNVKNFLNIKTPLSDEDKYIFIHCINNYWEFLNLSSSQSKLENFKKEFSSNLLQDSHQYYMELLFSDISKTINNDKKSSSLGKKSDKESPNVERDRDETEIRFLDILTNINETNILESINLNDQYVQLFEPLVEYLSKNLRFSHKMNGFDSNNKFNLNVLSDALSKKRIKSKRVLEYQDPDKNIENVYNELNKSTWHENKPRYIVTSGSPGIGKTTVCEEVHDYVMNKNSNDKAFIYCSFITFSDFDHKEYELLKKNPQFCYVARILYEVFIKEGFKDFFNEFLNDLSLFCFGKLDLRTVIKMIVSLFNVTNKRNDSKFLLIIDELKSAACIFQSIFKVVDLFANVNKDNFRLMITGLDRLKNITYLSSKSVSTNTFLTWITLNPLVYTTNTTSLSDTDLQKLFALSLGHPRTLTRLITDCQDSSNRLPNQSEISRILTISFPHISLDGFIEISQMAKKNLAESLLEYIECIFINNNKRIRYYINKSETESELSFKGLLHEKGYIIARSGIVNGEEVIFNINVPIQVLFNLIYEILTQKILELYDNDKFITHLTHLNKDLDGLITKTINSEDCFGFEGFNAYIISIKLRFLILQELCKSKERKTIRVNILDFMNTEGQTLFEIDTHQNIFIKKVEKFHDFASLKINDEHIYIVTGYHNMPGMDIFIASKKTKLCIECKTTIYDETKFSVLDLENIVGDKLDAIDNKYQNKKFGDKPLTIDKDFHFVIITNKLVDSNQTEHIYMYLKKETSEKKIKVYSPLTYLVISRNHLHQLVGATFSNMSRYFYLHSKTEKSLVKV